MSGTLKATNIQDGASATVNLALDSSGNVTVGNNLTVSGTGNTSFSGNLGIGTASPAAKLNVVTSGGKSTVAIGDTAASTYSQVLMYGGATHYNWSIGAQYNVTDALEITPSTAVGGTTFSTPALVINSSGNVGIGTASPASKLDLYNGGSQLKLGMTATGNGFAITNDPAYTLFQTANAVYMAFGTNGSERMRIDSSGNLLVGTTIANPAGATYSGQIAVVSAGGTTKTGINVATTATTSKAIEFQYSGSGVIGSISTTTSATAYNTSSDYRLKHDVQPMQNALASIAALKPVTYKWNVDDSDGEGFIAHELQAVIPQAVTGEKDAVDDEGKPIHQGVDYSKIVVHLVAALQEAVAKITALEDRITKLESGI